MKRSTIYLVIGEMQVKPLRDSITQTLELLKWKKLTKYQVGEDMEELKIPESKRRNHSGKYFGDFLKTDI